VAPLPLPSANQIHQHNGIYQEQTCFLCPAISKNSRPAQPLRFQPEKTCKRSSKKNQQKSRGSGRRAMREPYLLLLLVGG
jgi:hypothetical protein